MNNNRLQWLDFMKGVAIFLVVLGHVYQFCIKDTGSVFTYIYLFHMPFFFMLSGVLAYKAKGVAATMKKRMFSLLVPFTVIGGFFAIVSQSMEGYLFSPFHAGYWFLLSNFFCWAVFLPLQCLCKCLSVNKLLECIVLLIPFFVYKIISGFIPDIFQNILSTGFTFAFYRFLYLDILSGQFM